MVIARLLHAVTVMMLCAGSVSAVEIEPIKGRFAIGATGIHCVTQPCPWLGIVELGRVDRDSLRPLWTGAQVPPLRASEEDAARIDAAWKNRECLEVEGEFYTDAVDMAGVPLLRVRSIIGPCS